MVAEKYRSTMGTNGKPLEHSIIEYPKGDFLATIELVPTAQGFTSVWWVSNLDTIYSQAAGFLSLPVFGQKYEIAERRVRMIADDVISMVESTSGGYSPVHGPIMKLAHVQIHLHHLAERLSPPDVVEEAAVLYEFVQSFYVSSPVQVLAEELGVENIRTMQDRLDRARDKGILSRPGRGKRLV